MQHARSAVALETSARRTNHMVLLHKNIFHGTLVLAVLAGIVLLLTALSFSDQIVD